MKSNTLYVASQPTNLAGLDMPFNSLYWRTADTLYNCDFSQYKLSDGPLTRQYYPVMRCQHGAWSQFLVPANSPMGRILQNEFSAYIAWRRGISDTRHCENTVRYRKVGTYQYRPNYGLAEHRRRYACTEQLIPTSLIGTGIKTR